MSKSFLHSVKSGLLLFAAVALFALTSLAQICYVAPDGNGDGSSWDTACGTLEEAVLAVGGTGEIRLKAGLYEVVSNVVISSASDLHIRGGYSGAGEELSTEETVLSCASDARSRIFLVQDSALFLDNLTVTNASAASSDVAVRRGTAIYASNSALAINGCRFFKNGGTYNDTQTYYGGAIYITGASLALTNCVFEANRVACVYGSGGSAYGGAIYASGTTISIADTLFLQNTCQIVHFWGHGGALSLVNCRQVAIDRTRFVSNIALRANNYERYGFYGGSIYCEDSKSAQVEITDCEFVGGLCNNSQANYTSYGNGGTIYLAGASQTTTVARTIFHNTGRRATSATKYDSGSVTLASGTLDMQNVLMGNCRGNHVEIRAGTLSARNCTFADSENGYAVSQIQGTSAFENCVFSGNQLGDYLFVGGVMGQFNHSFTQSVKDGYQNSTNAPFFADSKYYHPKSRAGRYADGWFSGGAWVTSDTETCVTIDSCGADESCALEPQPNQGLLNAGYDGGTSVASKSDLGSDPVVSDAVLKIFALPVQNVATSSAVASGQLASSGGSPSATVFIVWDVTDKGTNAVADWANCVCLGSAEPWEIYTHEITSTDTCAYRFFCTNATDLAWSDPAVSFEFAELPEIVFDEVSHVARHTARVAGHLVTDGGISATVSLRVWPEGDESAAVSVVYNLGQAVASGERVVFSLDSLNLGCRYDGVLTVESYAGTSVSPFSFTTHSAAPMELYVSVTGAGIADGSNWENAFSNLQEAVEIAKYPGDKIYMQAGEYIEFGYLDGEDLSQCRIDDAAGLTISGGYAGDGSPGTISAVPTIIARNENAEPRPYRRLIRTKNSSITFNSLVFSNGAINVRWNSGHALLAQNSDIAINDCLFIRNGYRGSISMSFSGGAICSENGSLTISSCVFTNNCIQAWTDNSFMYGGAIRTDSTTLRIENSGFYDNSARCSYHDCQGGALCIYGGTAEITNTLFVGNHLLQAASHTTTRGYGGTIYAQNVSPLVMTDVLISRSFSRGPSHQGGIMRCTGSSQKTVLTRCAFSDNGGRDYTDLTALNNHGDLRISAGTLHMTNVLVGAVVNGNVLNVDGGNVTCQNVTIAGAANGFGVKVSNGTVSMKDSIVYGNSSGGVTNVSGTFSASYTCAQDEILEGEGNISIDPLFADDTHFHLYSRGGYYTGFFDGGEWTSAKIDAWHPVYYMSGAIDAGDPLGDYSLEPARNGNRLNLGAYGNTPVASKTWRQSASIFFLR